MGFSPWRLIDPLNLTGADTGPQDEANATAQSYKDAAPRPNQIQWNNIYDPSTMATAPGMATALGQNNLDMSGINAFSKDALRTGPSSWAKQATTQQNSLAKNALDMGAKSTAGQGATARSQLAMRGGLSSGASERLATEGQNNFLNMQQGVNQQKTSNIQQIGMNDEQNRMQMESQLPGMQLGAANFGLQKVGMQNQANQFDIGNTVQNNASKNQFDLGQYNSQMQGWAAGQTAAATAQSGKHKK